MTAQNILIGKKEIAGALTLIQNSKPNKVNDNLKNYFQKIIENFVSTNDLNLIKEFNAKIQSCINSKAVYTVLLQDLQVKNSTLYSNYISLIQSLTAHTSKLEYSKFSLNSRVDYSDVIQRFNPQGREDEFSKFLLSQSNNSFSFGKAGKIKIKYLSDLALPDKFHTTYYLLQLFLQLDKTNNNFFQQIRKTKENGNLTEELVSNQLSVDVELNQLGVFQFSSGSSADTKNKIDIAVVKGNSERLLSLKVFSKFLGSFYGEDFNKIFNTKTSNKLDSISSHIESKQLKLLFNEFLIYTQNIHSFLLENYDSILENLDGRYNDEKLLFEVIETVERSHFLSCNFERIREILLKVENLIGPFNDLEFFGIQIKSSFNQMAKHVKYHNSCCICPPPLSFFEIFKSRADYNISDEAYIALVRWINIYLSELKAVF
jgi:hypothetical protein